MPRDGDRRPRSRSRERYRDRGERKQRDRDRGEEADEDIYRRDRHRRDSDRHHKADNRYDKEDRHRRTVDHDNGEPLTDEQTDMMRVMGFCNFDSTKDKHVVGNSVYVANISKQRKYRQYMNRRGGFNRPLDPV